MIELAIPSSAAIRSDPDRLIQRCLAGEQAAYAALYRAYAGDVYRLVYGMLGHLEDAEEVVQDTFVYALRNLARFDSSRAGFRTWLFTIATSRTRNKRRRRRLPTISLRQLVWQGDEIPSRDDTDRPPETKAESRADRDRIHEALMGLPDKLRDAAVLRYFRGLTYREMGEILGIPHKTAESRVRLAHRALRKVFEENT